MVASVKHTFVSPIPDGGDPTIVGPNAWNADHALVDVQGTIALTTTGTSGASTFDGTTLNVPVYAFADTGITQLTADVIAGPGSGSQAATVVALNGTNLAGLATGLLVNTTGTGVPTIKTAPAGLVVGTSDTQTLTNKNLAGAGNTFPTFNQNTTGSAAKWTTPRLLAGNSVDGSANVAFANKFIVQGTADTGLSGPQFMGALTTGIVKNTTSTGVLSIAVAGTDYVAPGAAISIPSLNSGQLAGFRNALINGNLLIWQRATSFAISATTSAYTADRWAVTESAGTVALTVARQSAPATAVQFSQRVQRNSANTNTQAIHDTQVIETINVVGLQGKTVTLSFFAKAGANFSPASGTLVSQVLTGTGNDQGLASVLSGSWTGQATTSTQNNTLTTSRQQFTQTLTIPTTATEIAIDFQATPVGTAGANDWFEIDSVQLEPGSNATPIEARSGGTELLLCERYAWVLGGAGNFATAYGTGVMRTTTTGSIYTQFPVDMRVTPSTTLTAAGTFSALISTATFTALTAIAANIASTHGAIINITMASGAVGAALVQDTGSNASLITFSAEL